MRNIAERENCLQRTASQQAVVQTVACGSDRDIGLENLQCLLTRPHRNRKRIHQNIGAHQSELGEKPLGLLAGVANERAAYEGQASRGPGSDAMLSTRAVPSKR